MQCPTCKMAHLQDPENGQRWHVECPECGTILFLYVPMEHQDAFHRDTHKIKMYAGGYGSGKTTSGAVEVLTHVFSTPNGATLVGAKTVPQLDQTAKKELLLMLPETFIEVYHKQKDTIVCKNGHVILFRPLDDEGKIRSLNLTMAWINTSVHVKPA